VLLGVDPPPAVPPPVPPDALLGAGAVPPAAVPPELTAAPEDPSVPAAESPPAAVPPLAATLPPDGDPAAELPALPVVPVAPVGVVTVPPIAATDGLAGGGVRAGMVCGTSSAVLVPPPQADSPSAQPARSNSAATRARRCPRTVTRRVAPCVGRRSGSR